MDGGAKRNRWILGGGGSQCLHFASGSLSFLTVSYNINMSDQRSRAYRAACNNRPQIGLLLVGGEIGFSKKIPSSHPVACIHSQVDPVHLPHGYAITRKVSTALGSFTMRCRCCGYTRHNLAANIPVSSVIWAWNACFQGGFDSKLLLKLQFSLFFWTTW